MNEKIRELFVRKMELILDRRKNDDAAAATRVRGEMNARGLRYSSVTELRVTSAYEGIYEEICQEAWSELEKIAVTIGVTPDKNLADELKAVFDHVMEPLAKRYVGALGGQRLTAGAISGDIAGDADAAFRRSRNIVGTEIEVFSNSVEKTVPQTGGGIHIEQRGSGQIVTVQQGDNATATVEQNIDTARFEALRSALESLHERFGEHKELAPLIEEAKAEAGNPQPLRGRIRNLLNEIKRWIGVVKEGKELFETVETAAVECGIDTLPPIPLS